ncbi:MAG: transglutaminase-like domain-containing protein [Verrucomicrobia bacterium]|nr:transglutaminase-like domain-containing protein [Verrucomicrobiota bacterium]
MMMPPRHIALASMLIWITLTGFWLPGLALIALAESGRWHSRRWEFSEKDDRRFVNICVLSSVIGLIYSWLNPQGAFTMLESIQIGVSSNVLANRESFQPYEFIILVAPFLTFPIFWATRFRSTPPPKFTIFSRFLPKKIKLEAPWMNQVIPSEGGYALVCLASACKTQSSSLNFFLLICLITAWFLWEIRPYRRRFSPWAIQLLLSIAGAFFLFTLLSELQAIFQEKFINYIAQISQRDPIPKEAQTAIGRSGKINLSARIVLRAETQMERPFLLPQDFFDQYRRGAWQISNWKSVTNVLDDGDLESWTLRLPHNTQTNRQFITLSHSLKLDGGRLPLPMGTFRLTHLPVGEVLTNIYGRVHVVDGPGLLKYTVDAAPELNALTPPIKRRARDSTLFDIAQREQSFLNKIANEIDINNRDGSYTAHEIARRVTDYFATNNFQYSTVLNPEDVPQDETSAVGHFLEVSRKGHCEYFATATTLLMRRGSIPARYVTGYSIDEERNGIIIARERDRHAWCQYFSFEDNIWHNLDTTPPEWKTADKKFQNNFQDIHDSLNDLNYSISTAFWNWVENAQQYEILLGVFLVILFGFLIIRIIRQQNQKNILHKKKLKSNHLSQLGADSPFFRILNQLEKMGYHRADGETVLSWVQNRIPDNNQILQLTRKHYQYRFDPNGISDSEKQQLINESLTILKDLIQKHKLNKKSKRTRHTGSITRDVPG